MKETGSLMRCLHCGNRISLLRKLKDSEFCSDEHRDFYALQQQQLAVSRLMETSSPRHKPLPGLRHSEPEKDGRALPKGADRRGLGAAQPKSSRPPLEPAVAPRPPAQAQSVRRTAHAAEPVSAQTPVAAAAAATAYPPAQESYTAFQLVHRNSTALHGCVSQFPDTRDWAPRQWRPVEAVAEDLMPLLAAPRFQVKVRRRLNLQPMRALSGSHEWGRPGQLAGMSPCEPALAPPSAETFSEILSLSMHGFVCEKALAIDRAPYVRPLAPFPAVRPFEPRMAPTAEAGLGAGQLPRAHNRPSGIQPVEAQPIQLTGNRAQPAIPVRGKIALRGKLPEIDWTVERLDRMAGRHEPGLVKLRSPRLRSPQLARLVKPAAGSSGPPIRVRPSVRPPKASASYRPTLAMPRGLKVPLRFDTPVAGNRSRPELCQEALGFNPAICRVHRATPPWRPGMTLARLVPLQLRPSVGLALAEGASDCSDGASGFQARCELALPRGPFVRGNDFDPPRCGMVPLSLGVQPRRLAFPGPSVPALRPLVSYRWTAIKPELHVAPEADWGSAPGSMAQLRIGASAMKDARKMAPQGAEPLDLAFRPSLAGMHSPARPATRSTRPPIAGRLLPVSMDKCTPKSGSEKPVSRLEHIAPKPTHLLRKSSLKTVADWQRNRWTSASVYGSALWRIAIGKFSGALDQAPKAIRWGAAFMALALGAFALLPGDGPSAPRDTSWTMANNPGPPPAEAPPAAAPLVPRRVKAVPPPVRTTPVKGTRAQRAAPNAGGGAGADAGVSLTSAWDNFQKRIGERAAVAYTDDFRNGLAEWEGAGDWARSWSYDASGFVRTGGLALLAPSRDLTDYRMEFLGQIERRSMGWVVRAADLRNYYALKLTIVADGPVPEVALIRYPVINGVAGAASQQLLPISVRGDTVYRVQTEVRDDYYAVTVQGKVVDSWTDARLKRGSIGLFSGKGELARVRWIGVWHQYDTWGRLCALLAPGGLPGRERGANQ